MAVLAGRWLFFASTAKIDGKPLTDLIGTAAFTNEAWTELKQRVTKGGANIIKLRERSSFQSPAYTSVEMIRAVMGGGRFVGPRVAMWTSRVSATL